MTRGNQSTIILFIMGSAIVLAAVLSLAVSSRNRPETPVLPNVGEQVIINGQPITLRRNPDLTVVLVPPQPVVVQPQPEAVQPTPEGAVVVEPATPVPAPTDTPVPPAVVIQAPTNTPVPAPAVNTEPVITVPYTVQAGDTLYGITTQRATSIALMAQYGISQDSLSPGVTISLPVGNPAFCPGRRPYAVGEGETIFAISQKTNISKEDLQSINGLGADFAIKAGQILCVP